MANPNGGIKISTNFELASSLPLDSRLWVQDLAGLNTIDFKYQGLIAFVEAEGKHYFYDDPVWNILNDSTGSLQDAPSDGDYYVRKDGNWVILPQSSLLFTIPSFQVSLSGAKTFGKYTNGQPVSYTAKTLEFILKDIAQEALNPSVGGPYISVSLSGGANSGWTYEVGETKSGVIATVNVNRGSVSPVYNGPTVLGVPTPGSPYRSGQFSNIVISGKMTGNNAGPLASASLTASTTFNGSFQILAGNNIVYANANYAAGINVYNSAAGVYLTALGANAATQVSTSVTGAFKIFYGHSSTILNGSNIRTLQYNVFNNISPKTFSYNTGSVNNVYTIWMPSGNSLVNVVDTNTNANLTSQFSLTYVDVVDGSLVTNVTGKMYVHIVDNPYTEHGFSVTFS